MSKPPRYIDVNLLQERLEQVSSEPDYMHEGETWDVGVSLAGTIADHIPTADVREVVLCKNCIYGRAPDLHKSPEKYYRSDCVVCQCEDTIGDEPMIYPPTHYCGYGKTVTQEEE